jgi:16S rRNA (cytosine967-C5)-methyltransferase
MRRRVDLRWRLQSRDLMATQKLQRELLKKAVRNVRPGGLLVYSTCSLEPEENEQMVQDFLKKNPAFQLMAERALRPWRDGVDGAYVAALRLLPA